MCMCMCKCPYLVCVWADALMCVCICIGSCPHLVCMSVHMYVQMLLCVCMCAFRGQHKISSSISLQIIFKAASVREHELAVSDNLVGQRVPKSLEIHLFHLGSKLMSLCRCGKQFSL